MKIGILGAAFNPPHIGHLIMAEQSRDFMHFDQIWFMPTFRHTFAKHTESYEHRIAMSKLLIQNFPPFVLSLLEVIHQLDGNTIHLVPLLKKNYPRDQFTFIIGSDNLPTFHKWGDWQKLLTKLPFLVVPRAGYANTPLYQGMKVLTHPLLIVTNISSTIIRERIKLKLHVADLVTPEVYGYIKSHSLYV